MRVADLTVRLEWALAGVAAIGLYGWIGGSWLLFALLILSPDLSMLGYFAGPKAGAILYDSAHSLIAPLLLAAAGLIGSAPLVLGLALIWLAHVALDRALGYGLKYATGFRDTTMGRIGRG